LIVFFIIVIVIIIIVIFVIFVLQCDADDNVNADTEIFRELHKSLWRLRLSMNAKRKERDECNEKEPRGDAHAENSSAHATESFGCEERDDRCVGCVLCEQECYTRHHPNRPQEFVPTRRDGKRHANRCRWHANHTVRSRSPSARLSLGVARAHLRRD
jgi:NAD-dependent dihydropyrimidine dehydrogenase PreA subunit